MIDVDIILKLGDYNSENTFFEMDYANKWINAGYKSAFFNNITCRHIGRLTSERNDDNKLNAYSLNNIKQFDNNKGKRKIVNLERRPDRKTETENKLKNEQITDYEFFAAVDGMKLQPSGELNKLFFNNDFGNKRGVIGCALSHYILWQELLASNNDYYVILEDDFTLCNQL